MAEVAAKKTGTNEFEYHTCLKCKQIDGTRKLTILWIETYKSCAQLHNEYRYYKCKIAGKDYSNDGQN